MLVQRRRRWANITPALFLSLVFAGLTLEPLSTAIIVFSLFYLPLNQLLSMKWVFKHRDLQMFGLKLNEYE